MSDPALPDSKPVTASPFDAYTPETIAQLVRTVGVRKAGMPLLQLLTLGVLAGAFISFGALFFTMVVTGSDSLGFGPARFLGGVAFSLGLILVVIAGAELFTGNNLIAMAWAARRVSTGRMLANWGWVYVANFVGALATAVVVWLSGVMGLEGGSVGETAVAVAQAKVTLGPVEAFFRGVLCNALVCLAVWMCFAAHSVVDKILAIIFPISAFVALGFEHSVANMYLIPVAMLHGAPDVTMAGFAANLIPVTLGNIIGGAVLVALVYWAVYLRDAS